MTKPSTKKIGPWTQLKSKIMYENPWMRVREDQVITPDGKPGIYGVVEVRGAVYVVAINDKDQFPIIHQFRYTTEMESWEIPAGGIDTDTEDPKVAAERELHEEAGLTAKKWQKVGVFQGFNGLCNEMSSVYIARDLKQTSDNSQAEEGIDDLKWVSFAEVNDMIVSGEFNDSQCIAAIRIAELYLERI